MPPQERALCVYLNDHLAGSEAALELLARLAETAGEDAARAAFTSLRAEIESDQKQLEALLARVGGGPSTVKRALGWLAEKVARLKLGSAASGASFALFESLEALALGIEGKRSLWRALGSLVDVEPALAELDLAGLMRRADEQHGEVERWRLAVAQAALTEP
jgi:hypothetical protein